MQEKPTSQRICLVGQVLADGIRRASARSEEPILCLARRNSLAFVAVSGLRLVVSWEFLLPTRIERPAIFVIPPVIVNHLLAVTGPSTEKADLVLTGNDVALVTSDELGSYELRWRSDPGGFPAPPEMSRLLVLPAAPIRLDYLQVSDAVHQAVIQLAAMEANRHIHRTRLAVMVSLDNGHLSVIGQEIEARAVNRYYFDPRLVIRALELVKADCVEVGLTSLGPRSAFLSIVNRQPDRLVHGALLSIGLDTQRLFPLPHGRL
ncbi:MAG: hypothetical protein JXM73_03850 [Anaerolineae bacterium]|nr:hypothetical protein [Anaerolineae bacterium]